MLRAYPGRPVLATAPSGTAAAANQVALRSRLEEEGVLVYTDFGSLWIAMRGDAGGLFCLTSVKRLLNVGGDDGGFTSS